MHAGTSLILALLLSAGTVAGPAQLESQAERLASIADKLADDSYRGFRDRDRGNRADVEALFLIRQFSAGTALFRRLVADRRPTNELRDSLDILNEQARSSLRFGFGQREWRDMSRILEDISRELGGRHDRGDDWGSREDHPSDRITGRMHWRGRIDNEVDLHVQGGTVKARVVSGGQSYASSADFTSPLPAREVNVEVRKMKGRGDVQVVQQPARGNGYTAVIRIHDEKGGSDEYELELVW